MMFFLIRCRYSTMHIATFFHFVSIIIIIRTSFLCYSILEILLTLVVFCMLWLIIRWISSMLWLIIRRTMVSTWLPIRICFSFTKTICLWNYYIYCNWQKTDNFISSSSVDDLFPCSLIFLGVYDALSNNLFFCCCS